MMRIDASDVFIHTPMIQSLHDTLYRWIWGNFTGGLVVGDSRLGKSWAVRCLGDTATSAEGEPVPLIYIQFGARDKPTIRGAYTRVARALGHKKITERTGSDDLEEYVLHALAEVALTNQRRQVILLIDEAQDLTLAQLAVFAEIFNDQDQLKNRLMIVFIANTHKFKPLADRLLDDDNKYLRERFFHTIYHFYGIRTLGELKTCLTFFDHYWLDTDNTHSIVDHYCPQMRADGVSLVDLAELCWEIYDEGYAKPLQLQSWGMTYFQRAFSILLMDYLAHYWHNDEATCRTLIEKSIAASGIVPNLRSITD